MSNYHGKVTLETAGYLYNPFVPGADVWGHDSPFNMPHIRDNMLLTNTGIPALHDPALAQDEHVEVVTDHNTQDTSTTVLHGLAALIIVAAAFLV